ncbi:MAG: type IV pilin [Thermoplasmata archaeon]
MTTISSNRRAVSPVIAIILLVAITTVLAAVVYVTVSSLITGVTEVTPYVILTKGESNLTNTRVEVTGIESVNEHHKYMIVLVINGTKDEQSTMRPLSVGTAGNVTFHDLGDEKVSIGDWFDVSTVPNTTYELSIIYIKNGNQAGSAEWQT